MGSGPLIPKLRRSPVAGAILDGIVVGSLALMAVVAWQLGRAAIVDWLTALIFVGTLLRNTQAWVVPWQRISKQSTQSLSNIG